MRHILKSTLGMVAATAAASFGVVAPASAAMPQGQDYGPGAYFEMTQASNDDPGQTFVVKLTDPDEIQHARDLLSGQSTDRPHVMGRIDKYKVPYNPQWHYHYDPKTVQFFDYAIEVCDANMNYVEEHLDEAGGAFLPGRIWCPWDSRIVREVSPR